MRIWNVFRFGADFTHVFAIVYLLIKICRMRDCRGVSGKAQLLMAIVFTSRYLDLLNFKIDVNQNLLQFYNPIFKIFFVMTSYSLIFLIFYKLRKTYEKNYDSLRTELLLLPTITLALYVNYLNKPSEVMWTFSIYLESVAILPQMYMIYKIGHAEKYVLRYLMALGSYRGLYILNWIYRYYNENHFDEISSVAGVIQTSFYLVFFTWYMLRGSRTLTVYTLDTTKSTIPVSVMDRPTIKQHIESVPTSIYIVRDQETNMKQDEPVPKIIE